MHQSQVEISIAWSTKMNPLWGLVVVSEVLAVVMALFKIVRSTTVRNTITKGESLEQIQA